MFIPITVCDVLRMYLRLLTGRDCNVRTIGGAK